jgi:ketosteroid isomerase-like protein
VASVDAVYSLRESVQLAFVVALQQLPATQRAALILRDVLGWSAAEVADLLDSTVAAVNSSLQRARASLDERRKAPADPATVDAVARRYIAAWEAGDLDALVALLHDDVTISMPPLPSWFRGVAAVKEFFRARMAIKVDRRVVRLEAADPLVFAFYRGSPLTGYGVHVLQLTGGTISEAHAFIDDTLLPRFGAPLLLPR